MAYKQKFPSEEFGKHTDIDWIYQEWNLPVGYTADELGSKIRNGFNWEKSTVEDKVEIKKIYNELLSLNPKMNFGTSEYFNKIEDYYYMYNVIYGALSKFNIADIAYFAVSIFNGNSIVDYNISCSNEKKQLEKKFGCEINWVQSPETRDRLLLM